jgi:pyruvate kinase
MSSASPATQFQPSVDLPPRRDQRPRRNTKIVCTLGPASASEAGIRGLLGCGADVLRLNFSHADHAWHEDVLRRIRQIAGELRNPVAVMQDLCGPKIRLSRLATDPLTVEVGDRVHITTDEILDRAQADGVPFHFDMASTYNPLLEDVEPGHRILFDDGRIEMIVEDKLQQAIVASVLRGGTVTSRKGMNLPGAELSTEAMTDKDWHDLKWGIRNQVDFVALSFVRRPEDVSKVRDRLREAGSHAALIAKIERPEAVDRILAICELADGLMVARGDLGLETDLAQVPLLQKHLIEQCRAAGKPVITATQVLESMVVESTPTRAEVSDVANAVYDGTDAIMLSAETATGKFPESSVTVIDRVARVTESDLASQRFQERADGRLATPAAAVVEGAVAAALSLRVTRVVVYSQSGLTARLIARCRLPMPVVAVTNSINTYRQLNLCYGVVPLWLPEVSNLHELLCEMDRLVVSQQWGGPGDMIVVVSALDGRDGNIDTLHIHRIVD